MNTNWILCSLAPLGSLTLLLGGQDPAAPRKLARIPVQETRPADAAQQGDLPEEWKRKLGDADLDERESAFAELVLNARSDGALRAALEKCSRSGTAPELAWTARLALRELRAGGQGSALHPGNGVDDLRRRFEDLERHFGGIDSLFEDLRSRTGSPQQHLQPPQVPGGMQQFQGYSLQVGPDGVTLETSENVDGSLQKRTYKARDLDELLQNNPELRGRIGPGGRHEAFGVPGEHWFFPGEGFPEGDWLRSTRPSQQPPTNVLGIYSQKLTPEQAMALDLEPEQGLRIERVEPGTIAQILGIRRGDTLVELNGNPIYSAEDVRKLLGQRKAGEDLSVTLIGEGSKERRSLRWSPATPAPGGGPPRKL